ncbi:MAG: amino acid permease [Yoonia sp.]|uniref:APC family permease n=1 Tax=Yoonia sp. TaxID=2212373 RepID=UPI00273F83EF|nr:amino acid permease [Yoonia sp.]MDP5084593.1 amino acid permease [Yoonia sp.]
MPRPQVPASPPPTLRRTLTLPLLTLYGLGVTVGAGIYVLIGATAAQAGPYAWVAFLLAAVVLSFTAFSYAELATRYPVSAGESAYVDAGFRRVWLATGIGLLVAASGLVSASAITVGASGYLGALTGAAPPLLIIGTVICMGLLAWWGITQSVTVAAIITVIEILGLVFVITWGIAISEQNGVPPADLFPPFEQAPWTGIISATVLAFYAFVGFEDMVNVAEEVKEPRRTMPRAIIYTLVLATLLYVATCIAVLMAVPIDLLAGSSAPLTLVFIDAPGAVQVGFAAVAVVATVNGVLIQIIMVSRVIYGMADRGSLPAVLGRLSPRTRTPSVATAAVVLGILGLSLFLPIAQLAAWTSQIVLTVFVFVNLALIAIKRRAEPAADHFYVPMIVPVMGVITSLGLLATSLL